ncbi:hypothetical protein HPP92_027510 [Vanilla planifolia]|uniref:C-CAP/cofactor C-like domain-containing protein n=1 Tax=Vanilla planifolia TaxID=51239 RepID=A0A835PC56_VANPL|nr:hypothetical protein HPP92_027510 [Vanilla planifolia]
MPAAPVSAAQVHEWFYKNIVISLENNAEKVMAKENGHSNALDADVTMTDASLCHSRSQSGVSPNGSSMQNSPWNSRNQTFVEGISKASLVKQPCDIKGNSVLNCHDSVIYLLAPLKYAIVYGCSDATVILGAIGKVAPFNTYYPQMEEHLAHAELSRPLTSGMNLWYWDWLTLTIHYLILLEFLILNLSLQHALIPSNSQNSWFLACGAQLKNLLCLFWEECYEEVPGQEYLALDAHQTTPFCILEINCSNRFEATDRSPEVMHERFETLLSLAWWLQLLTYAKPFFALRFAGEFGEKEDVL